jgi:hypothetical protein
MPKFATVMRRHRVSYRGSLVDAVSEIVNGGDDYASWSRDGKQLYYSSGDKLMIVPIQNPEKFEFGAPSPPTIHVNEFRPGADGTGRPLPLPEADQTHRKSSSTGPEH